MRLNLDQKANEFGQTKKPKELFFLQNNGTQKNFFKDF